MKPALDLRMKVYSNGLGPTKVSDMPMYNNHFKIFSKALRLTLDILPFGWEVSNDNPSMMFLWGKQFCFLILVCEDNG